MTVQRIEINKVDTKTKPTVRLSASPPLSVWHFAGMCTQDSVGQQSNGQGCDLNRAAQEAALRLARKVASRDIAIEVIIDPILPNSCVAEGRLVPLIEAIAENASAAVEPGPGRVLIKTWWHKRHIGVDAIGVQGTVPTVIRDQLMYPGFTTRVAEWDTGFGLHQAREDAASLGSAIQLVDSDEDVRFRLTIPLKQGTPISPPEALIGLDGESDALPTVAAMNGTHPLLAYHRLMEEVDHVDLADAVQA